MVAPAGRSRVATRTAWVSDIALQAAIAPPVASRSRKTAKAARRSSRRGWRSARVGDRSVVLAIALTPPEGSSLPQKLINKWGHPTPECDCRQLPYGKLLAPE